MSETIKKFHTLDRNSKLSLILLKGGLLFVLKKCMFMFIKYLIMRGEMKNSKKFSRR